MGDVILVSSQKSNIGKTVITVKIGIELSNNERKVLLIDLSSGKKKIAEYLNVDEEIIYDIKDVLDETCSVDQALIDVNENLSLLPYPRVIDKLKKITPESFNKLITLAKSKYDAIIVDTDNIINLSHINYDYVDLLILINSNDFSSVKELNNELLLAKHYELENTIVIINKYNKKEASKGKMLMLSEMEKLINKKIDISLKEEERFNNINYEFLFSKDENTFNNSINTIVKKLLL
jgi:septum formation inhibitor-activating ATPase MinD